MQDIIVGAIVVVILGIAGLGLSKQKKKGNGKCIGCPHQETCKGNCESYWR